MAGRSFPTFLRYLGVPFVLAAAALAVRLIWEQTVWSWEGGPQMVGFSLAHSDLGPVLMLGTLLAIAWAAVVVIAAAFTRSFGGPIVVAQLAVLAMAAGLSIVPYGFWQRLFITKFSSAQAVQFMTYAAATDDLATVRAFLDHGTNVNAQGDNGTALHGAAIEGAPSVVEFLIQRGAEVNAVNAAGDSPLAYAQEARNRKEETVALLEKHGARLIRGTEEQRKRAAEDVVRRHRKQMQPELDKILKEIDAGKAGR